MTQKRVIGGIIALYNKLHQKLLFLKSKLDIALSELRDAINTKLAETLPRESRLYIFDSTAKSWKPVEDKVPIDIKLDSVGLAKENTLQIINNKIPNPTTLGNLPIAIAEDQIGLARESTLQTLNAKVPEPTALGNFPVAIVEDQVNVAKDETVGKQTCLLYDYAVRRTGGRLLATIDFRLRKPSFPFDEFDLGYIIVEGNVTYSIVSLADEGIPAPEGTGSPNVLKIEIPANTTIYVRVPVKAGFFRPFCAYITIYARDYSVYIYPYISLGGKYRESFRNQPPKDLKVPANRWVRYFVHWFMEAHHGTAEIDIRITNPNSVTVTVYIGVITLDELKPNIKGYCLLFGWEYDIELEVNNETVTWVIDIMIPTDLKPIAHVEVSATIAGDGTNPLSISVVLKPAGITLLSDSQTDTSYKFVSRSFKVYLAKRDVYAYPTLRFEITLSTSGSGKLGRLAIVLNAITAEYEYSKDVSRTVAGGSTALLVDFSSDTKHVKGGQFRITAPSDGDVILLADTPEGEIVVKRVPAGQTESFTLNGRYTYLKVQNTGSADAYVWGNVIVSDSLLLRGLY